MVWWYEPKNIIFSREQVMWIIESFDVLEDGKWPVNPHGSGYTDSPKVQVSPSRHAPFETPEMVAAEVRARLESTGEAGEALVDEIQSGVYNYNLLSRPAKRALNYISGVRRRKISYSRWKREREEKCQKVTQTP